MKNGCMFFNFGNKCVARLLTAIYTLRKVYNGPITVALAEKDETNIELEKILLEENINVLWFKMEKTVRRNVKSILKPYLFTQSPYENTLMFDGDLVFLKPFEELFEWTEEKGFLVTHFSEWYSHGSSMSKRVKRLGKVFNEKQLNAALDKRAAVNIGVLGYNNPKGGKLLRKWTQVTKDVAGIFIADEIAMQGVYFWYDHYLTNGFYNYSCHFGKDFDKAVIVHYHGNKHTKLARYSSRLWWGAVLTATKEKPQWNMEKWLLCDPDANNVMQTNKIEDIQSCMKDWKDYFQNKIKTEEDEILSEENSDEK